MAKRLSPLGKKKKKKWLNHTLLGSPVFKITGKILLFKSSFFGKTTVNHADFAHFAHSPRELCKIHYKIHPH